MHPKREKIIAAAIKMFSKQGSTSTTMQEIAEEAGVGKGTLYRYFENKEDLVSSLISFGFKEITEELEAKVANIKDSEKKLRKVIETQLEFYAEHRNFCRFLTREFWGYKNKFAANISEIRHSYTVVIEEIIKEGIERGVFKETDFEVAAVSLIGMINLTALHWFMFKEEFPVEKIATEVSEIYFSGLIK